VASRRVFFAQFIKGAEYSEIKELRRFTDRIVVCKYGLRSFFCKRPNKTDDEDVRGSLGDS